ncbi:hypothetical protein [Avibacterium sp. 20-129]|uniref:hypothetical protein n=1 Tax=Avibacterium sp. 20-129 TaxID=2911525 RepID=UPI002245CA57|nr:hypothetical protein [Avibacterium sp. 20-129]MCW9698177.1 hypothetical protein [Avibacterium sp. 20-129]
MKNSDFIQMTQCAMYSIKFPHDKFVETIENAHYPDHGDICSVEVVTNPLTGNKVQLLSEGYFFTLRVSYKKFSKEMLLAKIFELKQKAKGKEEQYYSEKEWSEIARVHVYNIVPDSSEVMNVFYSPEKELLIVNKNSKNCRAALSLLIESFGLAGFRSVVVSDEKLGLTTRLQKYLTDFTPMFKHLHFEHEATLSKRNGDDESHLLCRHLDDEEKRKKAVEALEDEYRVQSTAMRFDNGLFRVDFKLTGNLKIRSMKFFEYSDVARQLNNPKTAAKSVVMLEYLGQQFEALLKIAESTVLEFVDGTKLEGFV